MSVLVTDERIDHTVSLEFYNTKFLKWSEILVALFLSEYVQFIIDFNGITSSLEVK